jgi:transglutaminase-like putative cysteine protease
MSASLTFRWGSNRRWGSGWAWCLVLAFVLVPFLSGWYLASSKDNVVAVSPISIEKTIRYQFRLQNTSNQVLTDSEFVVYAPAHLPHKQEVLSLTANHDFKLNATPSGNQSLRFTLDSVPPYGSKQVVITATLKLFDSALPVALTDEQKGIYLQAEPYVETRNLGIQLQAKSLASNTSQSLPRVIYHWLDDNITDIGLVTANRGALYALDNRQGDCTEFMYLFSALARVNQIPTRNLGGFVLGEHGILDASAYHNWAEFNDGGGWHIADPQNQVFDQGYDNYIVMRVLGLNEIQDDFSQSQRFLAFDPRLKVSMN